MRVVIGNYNIAMLSSLTPFQHFFSMAMFSNDINENTEYLRTYLVHDLIKEEDENDSLTFDDRITITF